MVLMPGVGGFTPPDRPDGTVVVNPSYWVFEAFPVLKELRPAIRLGRARLRPAPRSSPPPASERRGFPPTG